MPNEQDTGRKMMQPDCLKGAPGNLRWKPGFYYENALGAASIAMVATRMLRVMLLSPEVLTERDLLEMLRFLKVVGKDEDVRKYVKGLDMIGNDPNAGPGTVFSNLFG